MGKYPSEDTVATFGSTHSRNITKKPQSLKGATRSQPSKSDPILEAEQMKPKISPEMKYCESIERFVFTQKTYPPLPQGKDKLKKEIDSLLKEVSFPEGNQLLYSKMSSLTEEDLNSPFMSAQITIDARTKIVTWIMQMNQSLKQSQETLHMAIGIIDDFCRKFPISLKEYQLMSLAALYMAAKYEEVEIPRLEFYLARINNLYSREEVNNMEWRIFCALDFDMARKVTILWYMEFFGMKQFIYGQLPESNRMETEENKENTRLDTFRNKRAEERKKNDEFDKFTLKCKKILFMVLLDYSILNRHQADIVAISILAFKARGKTYIKESEIVARFIAEKAKFIHEKKPGETRRQITKCVSKIEKLWSRKNCEEFKKLAEIIPETLEEFRYK